MDGRRRVGDTGASGGGSPADGAATARMPAPTVPSLRRPGIERLSQASGLAPAALALGLLVSPCLAAPAAAAPSPSRAVSARVAAPNAERAAVEAARRFLCPHGGTPKRGGRCRGGGGTAVASAAGGRDESVRGWDAGLPAVTRRQAPCPGGTVQARVLFWDNAVRCVPR